MRQAVVRHSDGVASADPVSVGDPARRVPSRGGLPVFPESAPAPCDRRDDPLRDIRCLDEELREFLRRLPRPRARERPHWRPFAARDLWAGGTVNPATAIGAICGGSVLLVVGGLVALYVGIAMSLYSPAIMMENANATGGLMRSWRITKRHWWSIFGAFLVMLILSSLISGVIGFPFAFLRNPYVTILATALASGIVGGWLVILASVAYDLLVRQPSYGLPPYYPSVTLPPPTGAAQTPQQQPAPP